MLHKKLRIVRMGRSVYGDGVGAYPIIFEGKRKTGWKGVHGCLRRIIRYVTILFLKFF